MLRCHDLLQRHRIPEDRERIVGGMLARLHGNHAEYFVFDAVALLVLATCSAKLLCRTWSVWIYALDCEYLVGTQLHRRFPVLEYQAQGSRHHLFKAERKHTVGTAQLDQLARQKQRGRSRRTVVVDVDDWDAGQTEL